MNEISVEYKADSRPAAVLEHDQSKFRTDYIMIACQLIPGKRFLGLCSSRFRLHTPFLVYYCLFHHFHILIPYSVPRAHFNMQLNRISMLLYRTVIRVRVYINISANLIKQYTYTFSTKKVFLYKERTQTE